MTNHTQPPADSPSKWRTMAGTLPWVILPLLGLVVFLYGNIHESAWVDEAYTMGVSSKNLSLIDLWRYAAQDYHPPLYYTLLWLFRWVFGPSIFVARAFSAMAAFGLVLLGAWPFRRACGNRAALIFMGLAVAAPAFVSYAQDIRMYAMAALAVFGMAVYLHLAIHDNRRADWGKAFLFTLLAMYVHIYALLGAFFVGLYSLLYALIVHRDRLLACIIVLGTSAVAFVPWLFVLYGQFQRASEGFWIPPLDQKAMMEALAFPFGLKFHTPDVAAATAGILLVASVGGIFMAMRKSKTYALATVCLAAFFSTIGLMFLMSWLVRPFVIGRYMLPLTGLLLAAGAFGLAQLRRVFVVHAGVIILVCEIPLLVSVYSNRYNGPMTEIVTYMDAHLQPGDVIVHTEEHSMVSFAYYFPETTNVIYLRPESIIYMDPTVFPNLRIVTDIQDLDTGGDRVWVTRRVYGANYEAYLDVTAHYGMNPVPEFHWGEDFETAESFSIPFSWSAYLVDASPPVTARTDAPTPRAPSPSPSAETLQDLELIFSGVSIQSQDDFAYVDGTLTPQGWSASAPGSLQIVPEDQMLVWTDDPWTVFYYDSEMLTPQEGIAFSFQYGGTSETLTLGIDAVTTSGETIPQGPGFYSVALKLEDSTLTGHSRQQTNPEESEAFRGELLLEENTWYNIALGFDDQGEYIIRIWEPGHHDAHLTYTCNHDSFPTTYYFVGFVAGSRSLRLDNFTVYGFQDILVQE